MRMDEKEEETEVMVGQSSMEELDYEASDNVEEESMEQQSDNNGTGNCLNGNEEEEETVNDEVENEVALNGEGGDFETVRAHFKENHAESKSVDDAKVKDGSGGQERNVGKRGSKSSERRTNPVCKPCNLVFENHRWLDTHVKSGDHNHVVKGFKPSSGRYFCYLCWLGFQYTDMLAQHYTKSDHKARSRRKGVYGPLLRPGEGRSRGGDRSRSPVRVRLSDYYEVDSVGECDTRGARPRKLNKGGKSSSEAPEMKIKEGDREGSSEKASKELAENVANVGGEESQKEKPCESFELENEGNNNESYVNDITGDHPSTESNDLNEESIKESGEGETFAESDSNVAIAVGS